jgi:uncharacterized membrane protein YfcA
VTAEGQRTILAPLAGGAAAGLLGGLFGVGGGLPFILVLVFLVHLSQHEAHATSLVAVTLSAAAAASQFALGGSVAWVAVGALAVGAIAGAQAGAHLLPTLRESNLLLLFAAVLFLLALRLLVFGRGGEAAHSGTYTPPMSAGYVVAHAVGGLSAGVVSSVFGLGGGVIFVPMLALLFSYGQHIAEGTSLAVIVPTALAGALGHHRHGYTHWLVGARLGAGGVLGAVVGAQVALALEPDALARLYGVFLALMAVVFVRRSRTRLSTQAGR